MDQKIFPNILLVLLITALLSVALPVRVQGEDRSILTTILPLTIFTENLVRGVKGIRVDLLMNGNIPDPHTYTLVVKDLLKISRAKVIVANGFAEGNLDFQRIGKINPEAPIILTRAIAARAPGLPQIPLSNPHTWLSPKRAIIVCEGIANELIRVFPGARLLIKKNLQDYKKRLLHLSLNISRILEKSDRVRLISFHDALDIFSLDYGIPTPIHVEEVHGVTPSIGKILKIVKRPSQEKWKSLLVSETSLPDKVTKRLSELSHIPVIWFDPVLQGSRDLTGYEERMLKNVEKLSSSGTM